MQRLGGHLREALVPVTIFVISTMLMPSAQADASRDSSNLFDYPGTIRDTASIAMLAPNPSSTTNSLSAVAAIAPDDVWAVGSYVHNKTQRSRTLTLHWNGNFWSRIWSPSGGFEAAELNDVAAVSSGDVWAVGHSAGYVNGIHYRWRTLILHWDGRSWTRVWSPSPSDSLNVLNAVSFSSATDAWAVGAYQTPSLPTLKTLALHWNGTAWHRVWTPNGNSYTNRLDDVSLVSTNDVWAVGGYSGSASADVPYPLALHWDGYRWSRSSVPTPSGYWGYLMYAVDAASSTDVWAGGYPSFWHWDGSSWSSFPSTHHETSDYASQPIDLAVVSGSDVWAVGEDREVLRLIDGEWSLVRRLVRISPAGVDATSATDVWVVGLVDRRTSTQVVAALHWDGNSWTRVL
jgi:hypothetical protein